ncbi:hypothetical protein DW886_04585 [Enterocloster aldenensis]|nr:hypothetical protein DW886_04585 [Enterocloster aldenensis]
MCDGTQEGYVIHVNGRTAVCRRMSAADGSPFAGAGARQKNKEKVKFMEKYGLWSGMNSAIVHIVH